MAPKKARVRVRESDVFFSLSRRHLHWSYPESSKFSIDRVIVSDKVCRSSSLLAWIILVSEE